MSQEYRTRPRVSFTTNAVIQTSPEQICRGVIRDLSMSGAYFSSALTLPPNTIALLTIELECGEIKETIEAQARVVREEPASLPVKAGGMGLNFTVLKPEDAIKLYRCINLQSETPPCKTVGMSEAQS